MTYATAQALRQALEQRLRDRSAATGTALDRLRRRVAFERIVARLQATEPGLWVLKGGMALEVRLLDEARVTKDIDLGLREPAVDPRQLRDRLIEALTTDPDSDRFGFRPSPVRPLIADEGGSQTWRAKVDVDLAGRLFSRIQLDVSPRPYELDETETVTIANSLDFAGVPAPRIEIIDIHRHAAEKFHGMLRDFGDRENSRVRDLVDLAILCEHDMLEPALAAKAVRQVWIERDRREPPSELPALPDSWPARYAQLVASAHVDAATYEAATRTLARLWADMFRSRA
jgi:hypothetical protein